ncbi:type II toxin-antitoxin system RelE/ParE family toxin [Duganella sp. PWIR1]
MLPVIWSPAARADLKAIAKYIAARSPAAALALHKALVDAAAQLPQHSLLYRAGRVANTRELVVHKNYVLVYEVRSTEIRVHAVLHSRQQYP